MKTNRSGIIAFLLNIITFGIFGIVLMFQKAKEVNITCKEDGEHTRNPLSAFIIMLLLSLVGVGPIYWLIYNYGIIKRMESKARRSNQHPKLTAGSWLLGVLIGFLTLMILPLVNYFKSFALWNQVNTIYNGRK